MRQKTADARGLSETNIAPVAFSLNQNSALCLPLVSDCQRLIWVHSNQINVQMDVAAELDKAFDRFPYLTQKQTAALARRCSLHSDQVKVWFMVQRLRYGISWDYRDILRVQRKFKSSWGKVEQQNRMAEEVKENAGMNKEWKRGVKESGGKKAGEVREEQSATEGGIMGENVRAMKKEKDREVEEDKGNTPKKRKRVTVRDNMGKKRMKQGDEGSDDIGREPAKSKSVQVETKLFTRKEMKAKSNRRLQFVHEWPAAKSFVLPYDGPPLADSHTPNIHMTPVKSGFKGKTEMHEESTINHADFGKLKEHMEVSRTPVVADGCTPIRCNAKTRTQLAMMKVAFLHCQYPDSEEYDRLVALIGVHRYALVQWFGDMRYYIKKVRPRWMKPEQHSQALANIQYRQCLNTLAKAQPSQGSGEATWKMKQE